MRRLELRRHGPRLLAASIAWCDRSRRADRRRYREAPGTRPLPEPSPVPRSIRSAKLKSAITGPVASAAPLEPLGPSRLQDRHLPDRQHPLRRGCRRIPRCRGFTHVPVIHLLDPMAGPRARFDQCPAQFVIRAGHLDAEERALAARRPAGGSSNRRATCLGRTSGADASESTRFASPDQRSSSS